MEKDGTRNRGEELLRHDCDREEVDLKGKTGS